MRALLRLVRTDLVRRIVGAPLARSEQEGPARLQLILGDDINSVSGGLGAVPLLLLQSAIVASCLVYMAVLLGSLFLWVVCLVVLGALAYRTTLERATRSFEDGRDSWDALAEGIRGAVYGARELKLHRERRRDFFAVGIDTAADGERAPASPSARSISI